MPVQSDIEHLLRRTEYVARPERVSELMSLPTLGAAVDNILDVPVNPGAIVFNEVDEWRRVVELTHFWLDRMAHDSPRPIQEKMAFFWHGHFVSAFDKVGRAGLMREQIQTFRWGALSDVRTLAIDMSTQVAMLRYLDNNQNKQSSPNQNFARELMELFLLGVGNYTEADVEAGTAAWTGHTDDWRTGAYVWNADWHDGSAKQFMGRTINNGGDPTRHGYETIETLLGDGIVPAGAAVEANRGRPSREVAAEFLSKKLWIEFAGTTPSAAVLGALRNVAIANDFAIKPWLRALLIRPEFYSTEVRRGLVRSPVDFIVASLAATGHRSVDVTPLWLMEGMGQRPLYPPDVSGWKHNAYWVNASAMSKRTDAARGFMWRSTSGYWNGDGLVHLAGGTISRTEIEQTYADDPVGILDRFLELMRVSLSPSSYQALRTYSQQQSRWQRYDLLSMILLSPDFHVA